MPVRNPKCKQILENRSKTQWKSSLYMVNQETVRLSAKIFAVSEIAAAWPIIRLANLLARCRARLDN